MESETLLIIVVLFCLLVLAIIISVLVSGRRKESTGYSGQTNEYPTVRTGIDETGAGETVTGETVTGNFEERLKKLIDQWRIIEAVKLVRETKNIGLKEAKDYINKFMRGEETEEIIFESAEKKLLTPEELDGKVFEMLVKKQKIHAIKLVKENLNIGLKEAKDYVEEIEIKFNI
jgi:ribosomal protein L7/L12